MDESTRGDAQAIIGALEKQPYATVVQVGVQPDDASETPVVVLVTRDIDETTIKSVKPFLDEYRLAPEYRKGTASFTALDSFIAHANRFKDPDSAIFADDDPKSPALVSVLDYHRIGARGDPQFGTHRGRYAFPLSEEWQIWTGQQTKTMSQEAFALFLEDHLADIADPDGGLDGAKEFARLLSVKYGTPAAILGLSRGLTVHVNEQVASHVNPTTGEVTLAYASKHEGATGEQVKVPGGFLLQIPVFRNGTTYQIPTRLRYRAHGGSITWSFEMWRASAVFQDAFDEACEKTKKETGLPLFVGKPE